MPPVALGATAIRRRFLRGAPALWRQAIDLLPMEGQAGLLQSRDDRFSVFALSHCWLEKHPVAGVLLVGFEAQAVNHGCEPVGDADDGKEPWVLRWVWMVCVSSQGFVLQPVFDGLLLGALAVALDAGIVGVSRLDLCERWPAVDLARNLCVLPAVTRGAASVLVHGYETRP
jgi:hypothetical protein